ncbi:hypothetical protein [Kibdelosporangium phytohabitans]|uniref:Uncharacterized protein n=1 Tax=Kibdelosporangium phytohabitans TaxID=860235 RepID=A0A0N9I1T6_9PSEU|nr:hypothetical protein [Kibdelosporangium phytohabitans]ALG09809.1 hypothetical protein AOZ06_25535 [Kibdelosporangium phytohabitans]MBE1468803.1 hypothetical protein [Kibdelosporangium phytohabitans]
MGSLEVSGAGHGALAEILGAQVAWWQLGFRTRRAVVRRARRGSRFPDPEIWGVALGWARHWLTAPLWWRWVRLAGATAIAVIYILALTSEWLGVDLFVTFSGALALCLPLTAGWAARQTRVARMLVAMAPGPQPDRPTARALAVRTSALLLSVGLAAGAVAVALAYKHPAGRFCPPFVVDEPVRDWLRHDDGQTGMGCPAGDTRSGADGVRYTPWNAPDRNARFGPDYVMYGSRSDRLLVMPLVIFTAWTAEGGPSGPLGEPVEESSDHSVGYVNFRGGAIVLPVDGTPQVHWGRHHSVAREPGGPCEVLDWPCITTAYADAEGVHVSWRYQAADAFNVAWWAEGDRPRSREQREVAGYELTLRDLTPATTYMVEVQACEKHFVRRSTCTRYSPPVIVRVP